MTAKELKDKIAEIVKETDFGALIVIKEADKKPSLYAQKLLITARFSKGVFDSGVEDNVSFKFSYRDEDIFKGLFEHAIDTELVKPSQPEGKRGE